MEDYLRQYGLVLMLTAAAVLIPSSVLVISQLSTKIRARPFRPNPLKNAPYECGMEAERGRWERFNVRYYRFALLFLLFDVEVVFPLPVGVTGWRVGVVRFRGGSLLYRGDGCRLGVRVEAGRYGVGRNAARGNGAGSS